MSGGDSAPQLVRCEDVWFEDGTVVLQADRTLFRVYAGVLSRHSAFFSDLFAAPRPSDVETYEGCLLVGMQGDNPEDVRNFLLAMLDIEHFETLISDPCAAVAILKLSEKYDAYKLRRRVIAALAPLFPSTLEAFDGLRARGAPRQSYQLRLIYHIISLELALEHAAPSFLPSLLHFMAGQKIEVLELVLSGGNDYKKALVLSPKVKQALWLAKQRLSALARKEVFTKMFEVGACDQAERCNALRLAFIIDFQSPDGYLDPLQQPRAFGQNLPDLFCPSCIGEISRSFREGRARAWEELPRIFALPPWSDLESGTFDPPPVVPPSVEAPPPVPSPSNSENDWIDLDEAHAM
ncbi:hypothetical protein PsYK624_068800 [Phanerochaete sordida]|uniref:BTB domain-containing protein n=1 Tax=Phanerochaete sordida TaxID=48140 RepID=A0A9P3G9L5_9APHY|nr:hypothetical protein PsYK624_068800 [Phanerochaete sordida]